MTLHSPLRVIATLANSFDALTCLQASFQTQMPFLRALLESAWDACTLEDLSSLAGNSRGKEPGSEPAPASVVPDSAPASGKDEGDGAAAIKIHTTYHHSACNHAGGTQA